MFFKTISMMLLVFVLQPILFGTVDAYSCPLTKENGNGNEAGATVRIYKCSKSSASSSSSCGGIQKEVKLTKGVLTDLNHDLNGYNFMAKFNGQTTCLSWRKSTKSSSTYTSPTTNSVCKEVCFSGTTEQTYYMETYCYQNAVCTHIFKLIKLIATSNSASGNQASCQMTKTGKSGDLERARIDVWDCIRSTSGSNACGGKPKRSQILLKKGVSTNLNYDVNKYAVMAKFYGDETCVSYRQYDKGNNQYSCQEKCWSIHEDGGKETEIYESDVICSTISCGGTYQSLRYIVTAKGKSLKSSTSLMITILALLLIKLNFFD